MPITTWIRSLGGTGATDNAKRAIDARRAVDAYVEVIARRIAAESPPRKRGRATRAA